MKLSMHLEEWEIKRPFRITGKTWHKTDALVVELFDGKCVGRGEAQGVYYKGETTTSIQAQVNEVADKICKGITRDELQTIMPAGGARNAIDCALWDLEAKQSGKSIWQLTGVDPKPIATVYTIGIEASTEAMVAHATMAAEFPILKIKLDADSPVERLAAIRAARPDAKIVVDANQGWSFDVLQGVIRDCATLNIEMIEQPLARGGDQALEGFKSPITLAADESCLHTGELDVAADRYDMINIKLDKTGGLTEGLRLARAAKYKGCKLMVGNMGGTSLAMAPAFVLANLCDFADIDGPLALKYDRRHGLNYKSGVVDIFKSQLWG